MTILETPELKEINGKIAERRKSLSTVFTEAGTTIDLTQVKSVPGGKDAVLEYIRTTNEELDELGRKQADQNAIIKAAGFASQHEDTDEAPAESGANGRGQSLKGLGTQFVNSGALKAHSPGSDSRSVEAIADVKTLMTTAAGWAPESFRDQSRVVDFATRPVQITDVVPAMPWGQTAYKYMEETTFTNNAAGTAEGGTFGEAALVYTEKTVIVEKVTIWIPVTDEQLEEVPWLEARLNERLPFMIRQTVDGYLYNGSGTTPVFRGVTNVAGIQTQAKAADPVFDTILKGATKVRTVGFAQPNAVLLHATDLQNLRLTRTADGLYILGNPADAGVVQRIWGMLPVEHTIGAAGTGVVGDFANYSEFLIRRGIDIKVSNSHSTFFIEGKQAIRADMRCTAAWTRPLAFCTLTGL